jgi:hypothetical protein
MNNKKKITQTIVNTSFNNVDVVQSPHITLQIIADHNNINRQDKKTKLRRYNKTKKNYSGKQPKHFNKVLNIEYKETLDYFEIDDYLKSSYSQFYSIKNQQLYGPYVCRISALKNAEQGT